MSYATSAMMGFEWRTVDSRNPDTSNDPEENEIPSFRPLSSILGLKRALVVFDMLTVQAEYKKQLFAYRDIQPRNMRLKLGDINESIGPKEGTANIRKGPPLSARQSRMLTGFNLSSLSKAETATIRGDDHETASIATVSFRVLEIHD